MIVHIKAKPNSSKQEIIEFGDHRYLIYLKEPAENNRANIELINMLAKYFCIPPSHIKIKFGLTGNDKILELN